MRTILAGAIGLFLSAPASAAPLSGYHVGNSLTWDSQPNGIVQIAAQRGDSLSVGYHIKCNSSLASIVADPTGVCVTPTGYGTWGDALDGHEWDYVTLQPFGGTIGGESDAAARLIAEALANPANADTRFFIYAGWPARDGYVASWTAGAVNGDDVAHNRSRQSFDHILGRVRAASPGADVNLIPIGEVLYVLDQRMRAGEIAGFDGVEDLFRDVTHLTLDVGRYVAGVTTYAAVSGEDPHGLTAPSAYGNGAAFTPELYAAIHDAVADVVAIPEPGGLVLVFAVGALLLRERRR